MERARRKFVGRNAFSGDVTGVEDSTYLTSENLEQVLLSKGWTKPKSKPSEPKKRNASSDVTPNILSFELLLSVDMYCPEQCNASSISKRFSLINSSIRLMRRILF